MKVSHVPFYRPSIGKEEIAELTDTIKGGWVTTGKKTHLFESKIADYVGAGHAVALNSCTAGLHLLLQAAGIGPGDEVVTTPYTFVSTAEAILYTGATPVFCDIDYRTLNIDAESAAEKITRNTKALLPVHIAGLPVRFDGFLRLARDCRVKLFDDAAHALGAEYKGKRVGSCKYSDMTVLSFHAVKHITTGEGGMVLTNNRDFYEKLIMFRNHGITRDKDKLTDRNQGAWFYEMHFLGFNYRLTDIQCALGISQLNKLSRFVKRRREIAGLYKKGFSGIKEIRCLEERRYAKSSWHIFPIRVNKKRDVVFNRLRDMGIGVNVHYIPIYQQPYYKRLNYGRDLCPKAEEYYKSAITLPLYPAMSNAEVKKIIDTVKGIINSL